MYLILRTTSTINPCSTRLLSNTFILDSLTATTLSNSDTLYHCLCCIAFNIASYFPYFFHHFFLKRKRQYHSIRIKTLPNHRFLLAFICPILKMFNTPLPARSLIFIKLNILISALFSRIGFTTKTQLLFTRSDITEIYPNQLIRLFSDANAPPTFCHIKPHSFIDTQPSFSSPYNIS